MTSYKKTDNDDGSDMRLNFWLSTGTVGSNLDHSNQGKTQLFRRQINVVETFDIFINLRQYIEKGYHTK